GVYPAWQCRRARGGDWLCGDQYGVRQYSRAAPDGAQPRPVGARGVHLSGVLGLGAGAGGHGAVGAADHDPAHCAGGARGDALAGDTAGAGGGGRRRTRRVVIQEKARRDYSSSLSSSSRSSPSSGAWKNRKISSTRSGMPSAIWRTRRVSCHRASISGSSSRPKISRNGSNIWNTWSLSLACQASSLALTPVTNPAHQLARSLPSLSS